MLGKCEDYDAIVNEFKNQTTLLSEKYEIFNDFCLNNVIQSCFDYDNPKAMSARANKLIEFLLSHSPNENIKHLLVGLLPTIITLEEPPESLGKFFISDEFSILPCTKFAPIAYVNENSH